MIDYTMCFDKKGTEVGGEGREGQILPRANTCVTLVAAVVVGKREEEFSAAAKWRGVEKPTHRSLWFLHACVRVNLYGHTIPCRAY